MKIQQKNKIHSVIFLCPLKIIGPVPYSSFFHPFQFSPLSFLDLLKPPEFRPLLRWHVPCCPQCMVHLSWFWEGGPTTREMPTGLPRHFLFASQNGLLGCWLFKSHPLWPCVTSHGGWEGETSVMSVFDCKLKKINNIFTNFWGSLLTIKTNFFF